jgi:hypothetical protein
MVQRLDLLIASKNAGNDSIQGISRVIMSPMELKMQPTIHFQFRRAHYHSLNTLYNKCVEILDKLLKIKFIKKSDHKRICQEFISVQLILMIIKTIDFVLKMP